MKQTFFLSAGEVNAEQELSLPLLTQKLIDIATAHANSLGVGNPSMQSLGCGWVLTRMAIDMRRYPKVNETYSLSTWVEAWNRHFSVRNFMVADAEGNPLGYATSVWMVLDLKTRENAGLSHLSLNPEAITGEKVPIDRPFKSLPRGPLAEDAPSRDYTFKYTDLDFYRHVNTVRYVSLLLNSFTLEEMDATEVSRLELAFMHEAHYNQPVRLSRCDDGLHTIFSLADASEGADAGTVLLAASVERRPRSFS